MQDYIRKPEWLRTKIGVSRCGKVGRTLNEHGLNTVCEQADCPNQGECFRAGTATFMLLGQHCTRNCTFCKVTFAPPQPVDPNEPQEVALAIQEMGIQHAVITSVTRDDLPDGGAAHFAACVRAIREISPEVTVEVLIPDFQGDLDALCTVLAARPDILNHNVETVPALYAQVRPQADFERSLELLRRVKQYASGIYSKSGFMLGLGETPQQVSALLARLHEVGCDIVTMGQYLRPSIQHYPVQEYVHPDQFAAYKEEALALGIPCCVSGPLVRSSYHAKQDFDRLKGKA
ncbi:MAG: lipoyl synthase [Christensenellaceae bacterium]|jgi:lipoic acid synthetase|nr:lipoyl synthase [Christensenellaceae bacterium]